MKTKNFKFKSMALVLFALVLSSNVWATDYKDVVYTFGSTIPQGWTVNASTTAASGYLKLKSGETISTTAANLFGTELLCSKCSVEVSCGTFGEWKGTKSVTVKVDLLNQSQTVLSTASATFSDLSSSESAYKSAIIVDLPDDPSKIATLKITYTIPNSADVLRAKYVRLTYSTAAAEKYTVIFNAGSGTCSTSSLTESTAGAGVNLPVASPSSACGTDGWTFAGWATDSQAETTTAPTLYAANSNYKPSSDCTLYAVYSKTESGSGPTKWMVATSIAAGDVVVISTNQSYTEQAMKTAGTISSNLMGCCASTYNSDKSEITSLESGTLQFTIGGNSTSGYTLKNGDNYLGMSGDKKVALSSTSSTWSISFSGTTATVSQLYTPTGKSEGNYSLQYNYNNSSDRFTGYTSSQVAVSLYKKSSGTTTYNSNPSCATCTNLITITKGAESNGTFTLSRSGNNVCIDDDATIIVSNITPAEHYHIAEVTTTNGTVTGPADGKYTVTVTGDATIGVTFVQDAQATVTWKVGGTMVKEELVYVDQTTTAPIDPTDMPTCANTFMGWSTETLVGEGNDAPEDLFKGTSPTITEDVTFNAVFAQAESAVDPSPVTIWSENFGNSSSSAEVSDYTGFSGITTGLSYSTGGMKVSSNTSNTCTLQGSSGQSNLYVKDSGKSGTFTVSGLNTEGYENLTLAFNLKFGGGSSQQISVKANGSALTLDGSTPSGTSWQSVSYSTDIPAASSLTLVFTEGSNGNSYIDDISLTGTLGATYSNYVTTCATYTVTWMSNGFEIRKDENVAPGAELTAPTLEEIKAKAAACNDHLVGWVSATSTMNPKVKQDTAPAGMVGQQVTVTGNVVYHAVYADVAGE